MKNFVSTPDFSSSLAIYLRFCRESRKLSQNEISSMINIGVRTYQRIEAGESSPSVDLLHKISQVLKIDLSEIMTDQRPEDLSLKFNFKIETREKLFSPDELILINTIVDFLKFSQKDSMEVSLDNISHLEIFAKNKLKIAVSDTRWSFLNYEAQKLFHNENEKLISCLNQKRQELGIMWANLIQNKIEAFSGEHKINLKNEKLEIKFQTRNNFIRFDNKFIIITLVD